MPSVVRIVALETFKVGVLDLCSGQFYYLLAAQSYNKSIVYFQEIVFIEVMIFWRVVCRYIGAEAFEALTSRSKSNEHFFPHDGHYQFEPQLSPRPRRGPGEDDPADYSGDGGYAGGGA
jgi:hypothetical protein